MGLILLAGTVGGPRKSIRGARQVLKDLEEGIFRPSRIWPNLASWNKDDADHMYLYDPYVRSSSAESLPDAFLRIAWNLNQSTPAFTRTYQYA